MTPFVGRVKELARRPGHRHIPPPPSTATVSVLVRARKNSATVHRETARELGIEPE
jgi:hypothetical protein